MATKNFHEGYLLGVGGFGKVYRGITAEGEHVAVKVLAANGLQVCFRVFLGLGGLV